MPSVDFPSNVASAPPVAVTAAARNPGRDIVIDCHIKDLHYGTFKAVRDTTIPIRGTTPSIPAAVIKTTRRKSSVGKTAASGRP